MNSTQLIGRETMISRLIDFHRSRVKRVYGDNQPLCDRHLGYFTYDSYRSRHTIKIRKEYDDTFQVHPLTGQEKFENYQTARHRLEA